METYWVYKYFPAFVFSTSFGVTSNQDAYTYGPVVFIRPKETSNLKSIGLREHELMHVKQFYRTCGVSEILYSFSNKWKLKYEVEAYKEQLKYAPNDIEIFAGFISTRYKLDITKEDALVLLKS